MTNKSNDNLKTKNNQINNKTKQTIGIIFGGKSPEHNISITSAKNIWQSLKKLNYQVMPFYIDKTGQNWYEETPNDKTMLKTNQIYNDSLISKLKKCDCIFILIHGNTGEDGVIAGFLQTFNIKYIGCNLESSALCFDKHRTKLALLARGIPVAPFIHIDIRDGFSFVEEYLNKKIKPNFLPIFIKPCRSGSSYGVSKINNFTELLPSLKKAAEFDYSILIEKAIAGRELECAVLEGTKPVKPLISLPAEIQINKSSDTKFYDYQAKYIDKSVSLKTPASLTSKQTKSIQKIAATSFAVLECQSMARIDVFLTNNNQIIVNEINTIPGFTPISQYPKMWEVSGLPLPELLEALIKTAHY
ncbi:MAG: D-alanine--D-alanine ligase [Bifidobacteriaceae bacterium]|jgi:D-alanine-D-alanine ligase|nr:D-alanine--D-alanine ligase [Bifidobacteriaceae bacterium]